MDDNNSKKHLNKIHLTFEFIDKNLDSKLSLESISKVALLSPFYFHRVFKFITGESLNKYITRKRIEKSASDLLHRNYTISEIAYKYGFNENASYSKAFKKHYGVSPTNFRQQNPHRHRKIKQIENKNGQEYPTHDQYICIINNLKKWIKMNANIKVVETSKMDIAYVSCIGAYNLENSFKKLINWAGPLGLMNNNPKMITVYHDSFKFTDSNNVRMNASILINHSLETNDEIGFTTIEAGKHIVGRFEIPIEEFEKSCTGLFLWMNENGYKKADTPPFEMYHNNFNEHPEKKAIVDFFIPIE